MCSLIYALIYSQIDQDMEPDYTPNRNTEVAYQWLYNNAPHLFKDLWKYHPSETKPQSRIWEGEGMEDKEK